MASGDHHGHGHGHGHGGGCGGHGHGHGGGCEHEHKEIGGTGEEQSLLKYIDTTRVVCFNERQKGMVLNCLKPYDQRLDRTKFLESNEDDEQLIIHIPFTGVVKLKSFTIIGGEDGKSPSKIKAFINREDIDFSMADSVTPVQEWELNEDPNGELAYPTKVHKFQNVSNLTLYIPENFGALDTRIYYLGLKGEFTPLKREAVQAVYELRPQAAKSDPIGNMTRIGF